MSSLVYRINALLSRVLADVRVGANLDLFLLFWTLLSGRLLASRGALFPALADFGLSDDAVRRVEAALTTGRWSISDLIRRFGAEALREGRLRARAHGGFRSVAVDLTAFFRPKLKNCPTKHYEAEAGKALPAIRIGIAAKVCEASGQRLAVPTALVRSDPDDPSESAHRKRLLAEAKATLADDEILILDRGFPLAELIESGIERFVVRSPTNFTARRATPPPYPGFGRPAELGEIVRPLARRYDDREIPATPPDRTVVWTETEGKIAYELRADVWEDLVLKETSEAEPVRFRVLAIYDPRFEAPLLLATPQDLSEADARALYLDRGPVEGVPQVAKAILGAGRQFVFGEESVQRLPETALLAGSILAYLAATEPAHATGFWDRRPKPTSGRLRRVLASVPYEKLGAIPPELRKKDSPTAHLPKGILGHRRRKSTGFSSDYLP
jgi:hypothetical protein